jgi:hypothetical protein
MNYLLARRKLTPLLQTIGGSVVASLTTTSDHKPREEKTA